MDKVVDTPLQQAEPTSILIFEGVFTLREELRTYWDYSIYLEISEEESLRRGIERNPGDEAEARRRYGIRYIAGQRVYHMESDPERHASIVVDNNNPDDLIILP